MEFTFDKRNRENYNWEASNEFKDQCKESSFNIIKNMNSKIPWNFKLKGIIRDEIMIKRTQKKRVIFDQTDNDEIENIRYASNKIESSKSYKVLPKDDEISACKTQNLKAILNEINSEPMKFSVANRTETPTDRSSTKSRNETLHDHKESFLFDTNEETSTQDVLQNSNKFENYSAEKEIPFDYKLIQKSNHNEKEIKLKEPNVAESTNELNFLAHQKFKILSESLSDFENVMEKYKTITVIGITVNN